MNTFFIYLWVFLFVCILRVCARANMCAYMRALAVWQLAVLNLIYFLTCQNIFCDVACALVCVCVLCARACVRMHYLQGLCDDVCARPVLRVCAGCAA